MNTNKNEKFNVITETSDGVNTVYLSGELDLSVAPDFRLVMEPLVGESGQDLIINLKELKYIDSTGIGILLSHFEGKAWDGVPVCRSGGTTSNSKTVRYDRYRQILCPPGEFPIGKERKRNECSNSKSSS